MKPLQQNQSHTRVQTMLDACRVPASPLKTESKDLKRPGNVQAGPHYVVFAKSKLPEPGSLRKLTHSKARPSQKGTIYKNIKFVW